MKRSARSRRRSKKNVPVRYIIDAVLGLLVLAALTTSAIEFHAIDVTHTYSQAQSGNVCNQTNVIQAEANVPLIKTAQVQLSKGMPQTAALVNGQPILSTDLEAQVTAIAAKHRVQMAILPGNIASVEPALHTSIKQICQDTPNQMINNKLFL
jgi:cytidylate kinase